MPQVVMSSPDVANTLTPKAKISTAINKDNAMIFFFINALLSFMLSALIWLLTRYHKILENIGITSNTISNRTLDHKCIHFNLLRKLRLVDIPPRILIKLCQKDFSFNANDLCLNSISSRRWSKELTPRPRLKLVTIYIICISYRNNTFSSIEDF